MKNRPGYEDRVWIRVRGLEGIFEGRERKVRLGETIFVGRSRECELHPRAAGNGRESAKRMSRRHLRVSFCNPEHVEIEDLSRNGTFLNGKRIDRVVLRNLEKEPAVLDLLAGTILIERV